MSYMSQVESVPALICEGTISQYRLYYGTVCIVNVTSRQFCYGAGYYRRQVNGRVFF